MFKFLKKDSFWMGMAMGIIMPGVIYLILHFINSAVLNPIKGTHYLTESTVQILSLVINLVVMRYYLVVLKADKTGRGILLITFVAGIAFFIFNM